MAIFFDIRINHNFEKNNTSAPFLPILTDLDAKERILDRILRKSSEKFLKSSL